MSENKAIVVFTFDEHCGHPFALAHPDPWIDANQTVHGQNALQEAIWQHWESCWHRIGKMRRGARLIIVRGGDSVEGVHHGTTQLDTARRIEQEAIAVRCWRGALKMCNFRAGHDRILGVVGTPDHVGPAGESDERVLRALLREEPDNGRLTAERLRFSVNGISFESWHKGPRPGARDWTRVNTIQSTLRSYAYGNLKAGRKPTRYYLWGHWHQFAPALIADDDGQVVSEGIVCPAWKAKDEFVYTIDAAAMSNIGMVIFTVGGDGRAEWECPRIAIEQDAEVTL